MRALAKLHGAGLIYTSRSLSYYVFIMLITCKEDFYYYARAGEKSARARRAGACCIDYRRVSRCSLYA